MRPAPFFAVGLALSNLLACGGNPSSNSPEPATPAVVVSAPRASATGSELVSRVDTAPPYPVPNVPPTLRDLNEPPPYAERTATGLVSLVIQPGTGTKHPNADATVSVHYSGWRCCAPSGHFNPPVVDRSQLLQPRGEYTEYSYLIAENFSLLLAHSEIPPPGD